MDGRLLSHWLSGKWRRGRSRRSRILGTAGRRALPAGVRLWTGTHINSLCSEIIWPPAGRRPGNREEPRSLTEVESVELEAPGEGWRANWCSWQLPKDFWRVGPQSPVWGLACFSARLSCWSVPLNLGAKTQMQTPGGVFQLRGLLRKLQDPPFFPDRVICPFCVLCVDF